MLSLLTSPTNPMTRLVTPFEGPRHDSQTSPKQPEAHFASSGDPPNLWGLDVVKNRCGWSHFGGWVNSPILAHSGWIG